jgi:hypothetical protein
MRGGTGGVNSASSLCLNVGTSFAPNLRPAVHSRAGFRENERGRLGDAHTINGGWEAGLRTNY